MPDDIGKIAQRYAERAGWRVHPVKKDKRAILNDWPHVASNDVEQIDKWWHEWPGASIGVVCGPDSGIWVLDLDLPKGPDNLKALEDKFGKLPKTLTQQTGSGGVQMFWKWNGSPIRNSSGKIAENIDVRGDGGYVVVPPSPHPSGNKYKWLNKADIVNAPGWLAKLASRKKQASPMQNTYGQVALSNELARLGQSSVGQRNDTLNQVAYSLGQLVAGGELDYGAVFSSLLGVAISLGLKESEIRRTIESGMKAGATEPRTGKHKNGGDFSRMSAQDVEREITCKQMKTVKTGESASKQYENNLKTFENNDENISLAERIYEWIINSPGSFTNQDIDREFCLTTRQEKINRSVILNRLYIKLAIKKDKRKKGLWHVVDQGIDFVDLDAHEPSSFPLRLPFDIHNHVKIPPKAIILLAGSSNAGKTAFILNTLRMNLDQDYGRLYLMSEMGSGEYKTRIQAFGDGINPWRRVRAASKSYDFDGAITHHNPDGLTCIDYLEEVGGEYYKIPTDIRNIYDSLGNGVALIAIQKRTDQAYARGGQGTVEKARLVMNLDYLATGERCIYCSLKLVKVKHFLERNLQNHEIHFKLEMGCQITPVTDWMLSPRVKREKYIASYTAGFDNLEGKDIFVRSAAGQNKRIAAKDIAKWQTTMPDIDVYAELQKIAGRSVQKPFIHDKNYFFQIAAMLNKKQKKVTNDL